MANNLKQNMGKNTTSITNPKTKSQNTGSTSAPKKACCKSSASAKNAMNSTASKTGFGSNNSGSSTSSSAQKSGSKSGASANAKNGTAGGVNAVIAKQASKTAKMESGADQCPLKDSDIITDVLGGHKALIKLYGTALCECDCPKLRTIINSQMSEAACDQFDAFLYMNQRGLYPTEVAPAPKVKKAIKQYTNKGSVLKK